MYKTLILTGGILIGSALLGAADSGYLKTSVEPGRAGVFVDGKYVGPARNFGSSRRYALPPGEHEVRLSEPRYSDVTTKVTIEAGKTFKLAQSMSALPPAKGPFGMVRIVSADKFAPVLVNRKFMGHAEEFNNSVQGLKINPGEYLIQIGSGQEEKIKVEAEKMTMVRAK
jgi:hypothetical protein